MIPDMDRGGGGASTVPPNDDGGRPAAPRNVELLKHIQSLRRYARALVGDHADADDLVQETLKRALLYIGKSRKIDNVRAYLFTILHNVRIDSLKRRQREGDTVPVEELAIAGNIASQSDRLACHEVLDAIQDLSEEHREVLLMVGVEGLSYREAAEITGVAIGTVMSRLSRAREALRRKLDFDGSMTDWEGPS